MKKLISGLLIAVVIVKMVIDGIWKDDWFGYFAGAWLTWICLELIRDGVLELRAERSKPKFKYLIVKRGDTYFGVIDLVVDVSNFDRERIGHIWGGLYKEWPESAYTIYPKETRKENKKAIDYETSLMYGALNDN